MLFVSIRSASQVQVPKVLKVVEETKRLRYKAGESFRAYLVLRPVRFNRGAVGLGRGGYGRQAAS